MTPVGELFDMETGTATFSDCRRYRYTLTRILGDGPRVAFIGLNPSTADETVNDPTIRRLMGFAGRWQYGSMVMLNLFAWRATEPKDMKAAIDPVGPMNDLAMMAAVKECKTVVACWGNHGAYRSRDYDVATLMHAIGKPLMCFGKSKTGQPKHPLYLASNTELTIWRP